MKPVSLWSRYRLAITAAVLALAFALLAVCYRGVWPAVLPPLAEDLGGIALARAERLEAAGELEGALEGYQRALAGQLPGAQDRVHANKRAGVILWKLRRFDEAIAYLERAQNSPLRSLNGFGPLAASYLAVGRLADAERTAAAWYVALPETDPTRADALRVLGQIRVAHGDSEGARVLLGSALALSSRHPALIDLAKLDQQAGQLGHARDRLTVYLSTAPPGEDAREAWALLEAWSP